MMRHIEDTLKTVSRDFMNVYFSLTPRQSTPRLTLRCRSLQSLVVTVLEVYAVHLVAYLWFYAVSWIYHTYQSSYGYS